MTGDRLRAGVVGVGQMGRNHTRIYHELAGVDLLGVADTNTDVRDRVAAEFGTDTYEVEALLERVDIVSLAVPTSAHAALVDECIDAGVHVLVEKPFVSDPGIGNLLASRAREADIVLQVGHVERFNPVVGVLQDVVADLEVLAVDAHRLGPPVSRDDRDNVVLDLMIHDIDIVRSLLDAEARSVSASMTADGDHANAQARFGDDVLATFTASRVTQRKVRKLGITAREARVLVDYLDQTIEIHRNASPAYLQSDSGIRHHIESVVERPMVESGEPLRAELESFVAAVRNGETPRVTATDGIQALKTCHDILAETATAQAPEVAR